MQLIIQCFTLALYSALLFLWESSAAALDLNNNDFSCQQAFDDLFRLTQSNYLASGGGPEDFIVIPNNKLISLFYSEFNPEPQTGGELLWPEPTDKVIVNGFTFVSDHTIKFTVKHPDEGKNPLYSKKTRGELRIVCGEEECKKAIRAVYDRSSLIKHELPCLKNVDGPYISGSFEKGVEIQLPWHRSYLIFRAKTLLTWLVGTQVTEPHKWEASDVQLLPGITKKFDRISVRVGDESDGMTMRYTNKSDGGLVIFSLEPASDDVLDCVRAAIEFFKVGASLESSYNQRRGAEAIEKKEHILNLDQIPEDSLPVRVNANRQRATAARRSIQQHNYGDRLRRHAQQ